MIDISDYATLNKGVTINKLLETYFKQYYGIAKMSNYPVMYFIIRNEDYKNAVINIKEIKEFIDSVKDPDLDLWRLFYFKGTEYDYPGIYVLFDKDTSEGAANTLCSQAYNPPARIKDKIKAFVKTYDACKKYSDSGWYLAQTGYSSNRIELIKFGSDKIKCIADRLSLGE